MQRIDFYIYRKKESNLASAVKTVVLFSIPFLLSLTQLFSQPISLVEVIQTIKSNHPELKMREANIKALGAYAKASFAWEAPQVGAGLFMTPYKSQLWNSQTMTDGMGNTVNAPGMGQFMLQFQQMIPNPVRQSAMANYQSAMVLVEIENKEAAQNELIAEAKETYFSAAIQQKIVDVLKDNEKLGQFALTSAQSRYALNREKLSGVYTLEARLLNLQNQIIETEYLIQEKKIRLNTLMNRDKTTSIVIDTTLVLKNFEDNPVDTFQIGLQRSDLKKLDKQLIVNELNERNQRVQLSPDFGLRYDHMFTFVGQPQLFTLMGMVNLPFVPWANRASIANRLALKHEREALQWQQESTKNEIQGKLESLRQQKRAKKKQYNQLGLRILPVMKKNYQTVLFAFEQNQEEISEVLDAWDALQEVQLQYIGLLQEMIGLQVRYEKEIQSE